MCANLPVTWEYGRHYHDQFEVCRMLDRQQDSYRLVFQTVGLLHRGAADAAG